MNHPPRAAACRPVAIVEPPARPRLPGAARDDGVATVLVLGLACVLVLLGCVTAALGAVAVARQRAASAADLSALAAAQVALEGPASACRRAAALAERVGAELSGCTVDGDVVDVLVAVRPPGVVGRLGAASARARAGPVAPGPSTSSGAPPGSAGIG